MCQNIFQWQFVNGLAGNNIYLPIKYPTICASCIVIDVGNAINITIYGITYNTEKLIEWKFANIDYLNRVSFTNHTDTPSNPLYYKSISIGY